MDLSQYFGSNKSLANTIKPNSPAPQRAGESRSAYKPKPIPNRCPFPITWPEVPAQGVKDYQVITTESELRKYLNRCLETGYCSFDWETAPDDATRQRWQEYEKDLRYRLEAAEFAQDKKLIQAINEEYQGNGKKKKGKWQDFLETPLDPHQAEIACFSVSAWPNEARIIFLSMRKGSRNFEPKLGRNEARKLALDILASKIFRSKICLKIAYNLAFESKFAARYAKYILLPVSDPFVMITRVMQIAHPELIPDPEKPQYGMDLKTRTEVLFGVKMCHFTELLQRKKVNFFDELSTDDPEVVNYSAEDSDYGIQHHLYWDQVAKQIPNKNNIYKNYSEWLHGIEMPFSRVIGLMEYNGMAWNHDEAEAKRKEAEQKIAETQEEIKKLVFETINLNVNPGKTGKTKQVREAIFQAMKLPAVAWSDIVPENESLDNPAILDMIFLMENNLENLDEEELLGIELPEYWECINVDNNTVSIEKLAELCIDPEKKFPELQARVKKLKVDERRRIRIAQRAPHPYKEAGIKLLKLMQNIQRYSTLLNSHIKGREKYLHPVTGRIHAGYTPWTRTSRLNSSKPNQQNVPRADNDYFKIRNLYKAEKGKILYFCDKSGFELRIMAWLSGDDNLTLSFNSNDPREQNIHKKTAMRFTKKDYDSVTKVERDSAKSANFLICYGGSSRALQTTLLKLGIRMSRPDCQKLLDAVFETYPGIKEFQVRIAKEASETGYSETIYGFKRLLPFINSDNNSDRRSDERRAANTPDQGSAAEIMKNDQNQMYERTGNDTYQYFDMIESGQDPDDLDHGGPLMVHGKADMSGQVHDEVIYSVEDNVRRVQMVDEYIRSVMGQKPIDDFPVPMVGESACGYQWGTKMSINKWMEEKQK